MAGFFADWCHGSHGDRVGRSRCAARSDAEPHTKASGMPVPRRSCSTGYADWMFGRGMKVFPPNADALH